MAENEPGTLSIDQLGQLIDLEKSRIYELAKKGVLVKSGPGRFRMAASIKNYCQHLREQAAGRSSDGIDAVLEGALLKREQRITAELKNKQTRGELVEAADIKNAFETIIRSTQSTILGSVALATADLSLDRNQADRLDELLREAMSQLVSAGGQFVEIGKAAEAEKLAIDSSQDLPTDDLDIDDSGNAE